MITNYLSLVKFSHTIFALPFAIIGYFAALHLNNISFQWKSLIMTILCMVFARNAAMAFNRYLDREIDKKNPRTENRDIPKGIISPKNALIFTFINSFLFILTTFFINLTVFYLSFIALTIILGYSFTKKFTSFCHIILGIGLSLAPIGAYLSVFPHFDIIPILFSFVVLFWVSGFDILYGLHDMDFDKQEKLHSIPAKLGKKAAMLLSIILHFFAAILVILIRFLIQGKIFFDIGAIIFTSLLIYQHLIIKPSDLSRLNTAFFTTNGAASIIFSIFVILNFYF